VGSPCTSLSASCTPQRRTAQATASDRTDCIVPMQLPGQSCPPTSPSRVFAGCQWRTIKAPTLSPPLAAVFLSSLLPFAEASFLLSDFFALESFSALLSLLLFLALSLLSAADAALSLLLSFDFDSAASLLLFAALPLVLLSSASGSAFDAALRLPFLVTTISSAAATLLLFFFGTAATASSSSLSLALFLLAVPSSLPAAAIESKFRVETRSRRVGSRVA